VNPQSVLFAVLAIAAGTLFPMQTSANALLAKSVGGPIAATTISFTIGWFVLLLINFVGFRQFPSLAAVAATPLYLLFVGGAIGAVFLSVNVILAPKLGAAALLCFVIAGQLFAAMAVDRLGLFAFAVRELSPGRVVGVLLVFAGAVLVRLT
jgi:bacterial/archaeal transporter family-2 protein